MAVRFQKTRSIMPRLITGTCNTGALKAGTLALASASTLAFTGAAQAGIPDLFMSIEVSDGSSTLFDSGSVNLQSEGSDIGLLGYQYTPSDNLTFDSALFDLSGDVLARPSIGSLPATLHPNMTFENSSDQTLEFLVTYTLPMSTDSAVDWTSDSSWTLAGGPDPEAMTINGDALWTVSIDDGTVGDQFDAPSGMGGEGNLNLSTDPIQDSHAAVQNSISVQLSFSITPGARIGANGFFSMVPAPGALTLLGLGGLLGTRRRRRN